MDQWDKIQKRRKNILDEMVTASILSELQQLQDQELGTLLRNLQGKVINDLQPVMVTAR